MLQNHLKYSQSCSPLLHYRFAYRANSCGNAITKPPAFSCSPLLCYRKAYRTNSCGNAIANLLGSLHTGKERDSETGFSYFGARYYDSDILTGWLSVDPMADKYPGLSPYAYCAWNPVKLVDPDGEKPRIYVELTGGTGHTFITVGEGKNTTVYTYGRYGEIGKESLGRFSPSGEGVLVRLTGDEAFKYISNQLEKNNASVYEFTNASDDKVAQYFDNIFNSKNKIPEKAKKSNFLSYDNSRVIDSYHLLSNNCTTKAIDGLRKGVDDKDLFSTINTPQKLKYRLESLTVPSLINYIRDNVIGYDINIQKKSAQEILDEWK